MGNNSILLDIIKGWMESLGLNSASLIEVMLLIMVVIILILSLLALIFRRTKLWYWKVNVQVKTLQSIDSRLKNVEENLLQKNIKEEEAIKKAVLQKADHGTENGTGNADETDGVNGESSAAETNKEQQSVRYIGKSGRIYTEKDLELQIRE